MEQRWWTSGTDMVDKRNSDSGTVKQRWRNSGTIMWRNSGTIMVEQWNRYGGAVEQ